MIYVTLTERGHPLELIALSSSGRLPTVSVQGSRLRGEIDGERIVLGSGRHVCENARFSLTFRKTSFGKKK